MKTTFSPPEKQYRGYIFDCDGTLADSMPIHLRAWNHGLEKAKAPLRLEGKALMSVAGMAVQQTIDYWNELHAIKIDAVTVMREKNDYFDRHQDQVQPIMEVVDFARSCKARGALVSVASGGEAKDVLRTLQVIGLEGFFPVVVTADDVKRAKPAPDLFVLAAERMGLAPKDCLVIEDSPLGVQAAEACGMDSVLVPHNLG